MLVYRLLLQKLIFLSIFILSSITVHAKTTITSTANQNCIVHLDKSFYVTGEIIWYKVYLNPDFKGKSAVIRAIIANSAGNIQHSSFIKTEGKTAISGYYKIPFSQKSGMYILRFSGVNKASKKEVTLVESSIAIYNDLEGVAQTINNTQKSTTVMADVGMPTNELDIQIQMPKNTYRTREKVNPIISVKDKNGNTVPCNLSVSIIDEDLAGGDLLGKNYIQQGKAIDSRIISIFGDKVYLKGIINKEGTAHAAKVLGAYSRDEDKILYTKSNENGEFYLAVEDFYGNRSFQLLGQESEEKIAAIKATELAITDFQTLPMTDQIGEYLKLSRQRKKIFQRYASVESNLVTETYRNNKKSIKPDAEYITKEYEDFEFMSIFFKENLTPLRFQFQSNDSTYLAKMYNPKNQSAYEKFFKGKPLVIVDGIATRNGDFLARMRMKDVEKIQLFYDLKKLNKQYKLFGSNGVTKITTYDKIESLPVFEANNVLTINGIQKATTFPVFDPAQINNNRQQPFFRPQLYWNPNLEAKKDGQVSFSYFQTDDKSTFKIRVVAQSEDGKIGYAEKSYTVK